MRNAFAQTVTELASENPKLVLLAGDIGNRLFDRFKEQAPHRFYNCGVAEAGMTGIAAGLASCGLQPITYTITPFNTLRCLEQIRLDVCYPDLPVILVGQALGFLCQPWSHSPLDGRHWSVEDAPNMHVFVQRMRWKSVRLLLQPWSIANRPTFAWVRKGNHSP